LDLEFEDWRLSNDCDYSLPGVLKLEGIDFDHIIEATSYRSDIPIENYFRYDGSYTTPSCAEEVMYIISADPIEATEK